MGTATHDTMPVASSGSSCPNRGVSRASETAWGARDCAAIPTAPPAELERMLPNPACPGPHAARTTRSSLSRRRSTAASASRRAGASRTTSSKAGHGVELRGEQPSDVGEPLGERVRPPLALEELGALERSARRSGEVASEGEVVVGEGAFLPEEHHDRVLVPLGAEHRCRDERAIALARQELAQALLEAVVAFERGRGEDAALLGSRAERRRVAREPGVELAAQLLRKLMGARERQPAAVRFEHERGGAAERVARGLRECVEGLTERQRRAEHLGDPVEAALNLRLPLALAEALCVVEGERGEARESVEELEILLVKTAVLPRAHAEHAPDLAQPRDRRVHDLREDLVVLGRSRRLGREKSRLRAGRPEWRAPAGRSPAGGPRGRCSARAPRGRPRSGASSFARRRSSSRLRRRRAAGPPP